MKENRIRFIFDKLSMRDRIIVFIFAVATLFFLCMMVFGFLFGKFDRKEVFFPAATMSDSNLYMQYTLKTYENLPIAISFPNIPFGMYVGGTEQVTADDGCSFSYNERCSIIVCEAPHETDTSDIITGRMYSYLYGKEAGTQSVFEQAICSSGYINGLYADYISGTHTTSGIERYLVGYRYYTGMDRDILFFVETEDETIIPTCKHLLDQMYYTMFRYDPASGDAVIQEKGSDIDSNIDIMNSATMRESLTEKKRLLLALQDRIGQAAFSNSAFTLDDSDLYVPIIVNDKYETAIFFLTYTNVNKEPKRMVLCAPDGMIYENASIDSLAGEITFFVKEPEQGEWIMLISNEGGLGTYHAQVIEKEAYDVLHSENAYMENRQGPPAD